MRYDKQSKEEALTERAVETTIQILYDIEIFDQYENAAELKEKITCLLKDVEILLKVFIEELNDFFPRLCSKI